LIVVALDIRSLTALELSSNLIHVKTAVNGVVILTMWNSGMPKIANGEPGLDHIVKLKAD
jgi:hypothetical protein